MGAFEICLIGISLSMDAAAVSMTNGMAYKRISQAKQFAMPLFFGFFQAFMPVIGYFAGGLFAGIFNIYAGLIVFAILGVIGGKMLYDGYKNEKSKQKGYNTLTYPTICLQAVATSIDAFAVGVGFSALKIHIIPAALTIGVITAFCSILAIVIGKKFGNWLGSKAQILGGILLIVVGIKAML